MSHRTPRVLALTFGAALMVASAHAATFTVTSPADAGDAVLDGVCDTGGGFCTLRAAIQEANNLAGADAIHFDISPSGAHTIVLGSGLPFVTTVVTIDGTTQPGFGSTPIIEIDATLGGGSVLNLSGAGSSGSTIRGLVINRSPGSAIRIIGSSNNVVAGNYLGTDIAGTAAGPGNQVGVFVGASALATNNNRIGGTVAADRNVISGNTVDGIQIFGGSGGASGNVVEGNYIGVDATGSSALGNTNQGVAVFFKDHLQTGVENQLPPYMVETSYLWTASDPAYAAVNGDDLLPDLAIGRLPAKTLEELGTMVAKILDDENGEPRPERFVLIADDPDAAGDFESDAEEIATTLLDGRETRRVYLGELGVDATRDAILESFDAGASTMSYVGHGGIHLWADENLFDTSRVEQLSPQPRKPLLLTMNCLNGYFHFPYFDSLAEALLKQRDRGVVAAFSPSGLSLNAPAHRYHKLLIEELVHGGHERLGDAILAAQTRYADSGAFPELLGVYNLLGDPAAKIR